MTKKTMSVQEGLNKIKLYDSKINKAIDSAKFAEIEQKGKLKNSNLTIKEFKDNAKGSFDKIKQLIKNRNKIKSAIITSNAKSKITIGEQEMTVAEAIERKDSISYEQSLLHKLNQDFIYANKKVEIENNKIDDELSRVIDSAIGKDGASNKDSATTIKTLTEAYENKRASLSEGINDLSIAIDNLSDSISEFLSNVDYSLTESNVKTEIEVDLEKE